MFGKQINRRLFSMALGVTAILFTGFEASVHAADTAAFVPDRATTALLITDPQNDFMAEDGAAWGLVKDNVIRLGTRENIERLMRSAVDHEMPVFISPHAYHDGRAQWQSRGPIQALMHDIDMFQVAGATGFGSYDNTGSDIYAPLKPLVAAGDVTIASPHRIYGPESNDLALQLRKRGIQTVVLGGFAANLCTDSHMRELVENGFNVVVVKDAVGAPGEEAYAAAVLNYGMIAHGVWSTEETVAFFE